MIQYGNAMDKNTIIAKIAQESEDKLLLARIWDKYEQMERRGIPTATVFLTAREQLMAQTLLSTMGIRTGYRFDGGFDDAERKLLLFLPDWAEDFDDEIAFVRAAFHGADSTLTHRDILGSLMGLGITREKLGDILISPHSADVMVSPTLTDFLLREWSSAGRVRLSVTQIARDEICESEVKITQVSDTVSSLRLDAVVSSAFSMSRGKAAELIAAGKVSLDHTPCIKGDKTVGQDSVITARGFGKAVVRECSRISKKGRIILLIDRYT
ncbi:MAG: hypothetical protein IKM11_02670 [Oscillospiraceae bacterium]|nr:hypothetical protein [Oscillospiraceae bacterium]